MALESKHKRTVAFNIDRALIEPLERIQGGHSRSDAINACIRHALEANNHDKMYTDYYRDRREWQKNKNH
jgi:metal-responsive CopG/Arc/MetJ family transcriptional regulator